jgi:hypothetical protein
MRHDRPMTLVFVRWGPVEPRLRCMKAITLLSGDSFHGLAGVSWLLGSISQRRWRNALPASESRRKSFHAY